MNVTIAAELLEIAARGRTIWTREETAHAIIGMVRRHCPAALQPMQSGQRQRAEQRIVTIGGRRVMVRSPRPAFGLG